MKILFLGQKSATPLLLSWMKKSQIEEDQSFFLEVFDNQTKKPSPSDWEKALKVLNEFLPKFNGVVLCGRTAKAAFKKLKLEMPNVSIELPVSKNQNLNNPETEAFCIISLKMLKSALDHELSKQGG